MTVSLENIKKTRAVNELMEKMDFTVLHRSRDEQPFKQPTSVPGPFGGRGKRPWERDCETAYFQLLHSRETNEGEGKPS